MSRCSVRIRITELLWATLRHIESNPRCANLVESADVHRLASTDAHRNPNRLSVGQRSYASLFKKRAWLVI